MDEAERQAAETGTFPEIETNPGNGGEREHATQKEVQSDGGVAGQDVMERETEDRRQWIRGDAQAFAAEFPEVDLAELDNNKAFRRFCGSRYGREPLAGLYRDYLEIAGGAEQAGRARSEGKQARETGTGSGRGGGDGLTAAQQRDLEEWNRAFPGMKMTAKEFLSR